MNNDLQPVNKAQQILTLFEALRVNLSGAKNERDDEYIHQSRVYSRRLRTTIQVFTPKIRVEDAERWGTALKKITQSLGEARDADVQIQFLKELVTEGIDTRPGVMYILAKQKAKRAEMQEAVLASITEFEESGVLKEMEDAFRERAELKPTMNGSTQYLFQEYLRAKISEITPLEHYSRVESTETEHHKLRIMVKRLRYALELYQTYEAKAEPTVNTLKRFQEQLGSLHDSDVWIDYTSSFTKKGVDDCPPKKRVEIERDIDKLYKQLKAKRHEIYVGFAADWAKERKSGFFDSLRVLSTNFSAPEASTPYKKTLPRVQQVAQKYDSDPTHTKQVTALALNLFDELITLHGLTRRERALLEYAAILHDIGWYRGSEGHNLHSREMILSEGDLPFDCTTRIMVALIARYHKDGRPSRRDEYYAMLLDEEARRVDELSAILRLADGLDAKHSNVVKSVKAKHRESLVELQCKVDSDYTMEEDAIRRKKKLFKKVFNKPVKIEWKMV